MKDVRCQVHLNHMFQGKKKKKKKVPKWRKHIRICLCFFSPCVSFCVQHNQSCSKSKGINAAVLVLLSASNVGGGGPRRERHLSPDCLLFSLAARSTHIVRDNKSTACVCRDSFSSWGGKNKKHNIDSYAHWPLY